MKCILLFIACFLFLHPNFASAEDRIGRFYELDAEPVGKPIFVQKIHREMKPNGERVSDSTIADPEGKIILTEHSVTLGPKVLSQKLEQKQIGKAFELTSNGDQITFRTYKIDGEKQELLSEKTMHREPTFLTGPATDEYLKQYFTEKNVGEKATVDFGVFELERPIAFEFLNRGLTDDGKELKVSLRPESMWVSMLVDPIFMEFDKNTFALLKYKGRTPIRRLIHGSWKPLDALAVYSDK